MNGLTREEALAKIIAEWDKGDWDEEFAPRVYDILERYTGRKPEHPNVEDRVKQIQQMQEARAEHFRKTGQLP